MHRRSDHRSRRGILCRSIVVSLAPHREVIRERSSMSTGRLNRFTPSVVLIPIAK